MLCSQAINRISRALGFRQPGHSLEPAILDAILEAQRDLNQRKTLPSFLKVEDAQIILHQGEHVIGYGPFAPPFNDLVPGNFLRLDDDNLPHYTNLDTFIPQYLEYVPSYRDATARVMTLQRPGEPAQTVLAPRLFTIRSDGFDFISTADRDYTLLFNYYKLADELSVDTSNEWIAAGPNAEWLIGEAGLRIARDLRDDAAAALFTEMRDKGRAATFGEDLAFAESGGPYVMGSKL